MIPSDLHDFPPALTAVAAAPRAHEGDEGIDYEPFEGFLSPEDTTAWLRAWTGDEALVGDAFRVIGQNGAGGYVAFWRVRPDRPVTDQPVVFCGSEGEMCVLAQDLSGFLWLLADGYGPIDVAYPGQREPLPEPGLLTVAERYADAGSRRPAPEILASAAAEFPDFEETIEALCP
ncbi:SMI1/KNR4 family protein [Streptomyces sp. NPDC048350]|uniref:SMI1/KNR4 family protein n=1 Tax=Streptomyces sp. NPDC048350 TaxID=3365538 RepID=UPI00371A9917